MLGREGESAFLSSRSRVDREGPLSHQLTCQAGQARQWLRSRTWVTACRSGSRAHPMSPSTLLLAVALSLQPPARLLLQLGPTKAPFPFLCLQPN
jgi:hypothetical protein